MDHGHNTVMLNFIEEADTGRSMSKADLVADNKYYYDSKNEGWLNEKAD